MAMAMAALLAAAPPSAQPQSPYAPPPQNQLSLMASASVDATMDVLSVTFATTRDAADAAGVQAQLKQLLDAALSEARKAARPGQVEVQTGNFSLYPRYGQNGVITGWQGRAELVVEGRDIGAIAQLTARIQTLAIARVAYSLSREAREKIEADVSAQAIKRFRERAQTHAQQFGFGAYQIREVTVGTGGDAPPVPVMRARAAGASAAEAALPVEAGKTTVTATVSGSVQMLK
jgi:predicted secreted protein